MTGTSRSGNYDDAVARGISFMEANQLASGEVPVYANGSLDPSVFATAAAAHALSYATEADVVRQRALDFLQRECDDRGLWKHWTSEHPQHALIPPDLDDTSCASAALTSAGRSMPDNKRMLLANRRSRDGLFRTWKIGERELRHPLALYAFFHRTSAKPLDVDSVVNANVLFYLGHIPETRSVVPHLLRVLREDRERACDKWYDNPFVVWYFFSRAMRGAAPEAGAIITSKVRASTPSNALDRALAACAMLDWNESPDVRPLVGGQLASGAWPAAALYHGGRELRRDGTYGEPHPDAPRWQSQELTTAFCIEALARARRLG